MTVIKSLITKVVRGFSFVKAGERIEEIKTITADEARRLKVNIQMGVGKLNIAGGSKEWMDGTFLYRENKLVPLLSYTLQDDQGIISLQQKSNSLKRRGGSEWDLNLTNELPVELQIETGASSSSLDLSGTQIKKVDIQTGVGNLELDLSGDWQESFQVNLECGVGDTTIHLPEGIGVRIETAQGLGKIKADGLTYHGDSLVNKAYGDSEVTIDIDANMGVGGLTFKSG
ncbi:toast rack family protein [Halobacillus litoralis]|nr:toast rack family protein [Halobacillus litoralis]